MVTLTTVAQTDSLRSASTTPINQEAYLEMDSVRVTPSSLEFFDIYQKKSTSDRFTIQNCGVHVANIRIGTPTSILFTVKTIDRGKQISAGMTIHRTVHFTSRKVQKAQYNIPIYINNKLVNLKLITTPSTSEIVYYEDVINFGLIDHSMFVKKKSFRVSNEGYRSCRFHVELGENKMQLIVLPNKGTIKSRSDMYLEVEVTPDREGDFEVYFTLHCTNTRRIKVVGCTMMGRLEIRNVVCCPDFAMINLPRTYYGTKSTRYLVVRNDAASRTIFCVLHYDGVTYQDFLTARKHHKELAPFQIEPQDGRLESMESKMFTITYEPVFDHQPKLQYDLAMFAIRKLSYCKELCESDYPKGIYANLKKLSKQSQVYTQPALGQTSSISLDAYSLASSDEEQTLFQKQRVELSSELISICIHGERERVEVEGLPNHIDVKDLTLNKSLIRTVVIKNLSMVLPIFVCYEKITGIDVTPKSMRLEANSSHEFEVSLVMSRYGTEHRRMKFKLHSCDQTLVKSEFIRNCIGEMQISVVLSTQSITKHPKPQINFGITPVYVKEIGFAVEAISYDNPKAELPVMTIDKDAQRKYHGRNEFIAFPNDTTTNLQRPIYDTRKYTTIHARIPRPILDVVDQYQLTKEQQVRLAQNRQFYNNYLKQNRLELFRKLHEADKLPEYELGNIRRFLLYRTFADVIRDSLDNDTFRFSEKLAMGFLPLTPIQLHNVHIEPLQLICGPVAPYSRLKSSFVIRNTNNVKVRVYLLPDKQRFLFHQGEAIMIPADCEHTVEFTLYSEYEGNHTMLIQAIINEAHITEITVCVLVVPKMLEPSVSELVFAAEDGLYKEIELRNTLNTPINFRWSSENTNFSIEPAVGRVLPGKAMACLVTYEPTRGMEDSGFMVLSTPVANRRNIRVEAAPMKKETFLCTHKIEFGRVAMNLPENKLTTLWNFSDRAVAFEIQSHLLDGLTIEPNHGTIAPKSCENLNVMLQSLDCVDMRQKCLIIINNDSSLTHSLAIHGRVCFPNLEFTPDIVRLKKFPITGSETVEICLKNSGHTASTASLDFSHNKDFTISIPMDNNNRLTKVNLLLEPGSTKKFNLHITPSHVTNYSECLPFTINNVLGPPLGHSSIASNTRMYLPDRAVNHAPLKIPVVSINFSIMPSSFLFSKDQFNFYYSPFMNDDNIVTDLFTVTNISLHEQEFCVRRDDLGHSFLLSWHDGNEAIDTRHAITFILQSGEHCSLSIKFVSHNPGTFHAKFSLYVRDDYKEDIHRTIYCTGVFELPQLHVPKEVFFEFVPPNYEYEKTVDAVAVKHRKDCRIMVDHSIDKLKVDVRVIHEERAQRNLVITFIYDSESEEQLRSKVYFYCQCGASAETICIAATDSSIFTTYRTLIRRESRTTENSLIRRNRSESILSSRSEFETPLDTKHHWKGTSSFPSFPLNLSGESKNMLMVVDIIDHWIYTQGFFTKYYFRFPSQYSKIFTIPKAAYPGVDDKAGKRRLYYITPFLELLKNLLHANMFSKFCVTVPNPNCHLERTCYLYKLFRSVIAFLNEHGAVMPHVTAEFLLSYSDHVYFHRKIKTYSIMEEVPVIRKSEYKNRSKQCWLDIMMQTLRIFVINRIRELPNYGPIEMEEDDNDEEDIEVSEIAKSRHYSFVPPKSYSALPKVQQEFTFSEEIQHELQIYSLKERYLLKWLNSNYHTTVSSFCDPEHMEKALQRQVTNFDTYLADGLVFAAVTISYCPYLLHHLSNLYWNPGPSEEFQHNAMKLMAAWSAVRYSLSLLPQNICDTNIVQTALLVAYLHEFLPPLRPLDDIYVRATLSHSNTVKITVSNRNEFPVAYQILFFENEHKCFTAAHTVVTVKSNCAETVIIKFTARYVAPVKATIVFAGETTTNHYARGLAYNLFGTADLRQPSSTFRINGHLYTSQQQEIHIQSPYKVATTYAAHLSFGEYTDWKSLETMSVAEYMKQQVPDRIMFDESNLVCNRSGQSVWTLSAIFLVMKETDIRVYFVNDDVGDFCISIKLHWNDAIEVELIKAHVPPDFLLRPCLCTKRGPQACRRFINVKIPTVNNLFVKCFTEVFVRQKKDHTEFWTSYLNDISSFRHLKKISEHTNNSDMANVLGILTSSREYKVRILNLTDKDLTSEKTLQIHDARHNLAENSFVNLRVHLNNNRLKSFDAQLLCDQYAEIRKYHVVLYPLRRTPSMSIFYDKQAFYT